MGHDLYDVIRAAVNCAPLSLYLLAPFLSSIFSFSLSPGRYELGFKLKVSRTL